MNALHRVLSTLAIAAYASVAFASEDKVLRYEDSPPRTTRLTLTPVPHSAQSGQEAFSHTVMAADRHGSVLLLSGSNSFRVFDPVSGDFETVRLKGTPESLEQGLARAFTLGGDGNLHVFYEIEKDNRPGYRIATFDAKGRFVRVVPIELIGPMEASLAVSPSGEYYISCLNVSPFGGHPKAPVSVFQKDGAFKQRLGEWEESSNDAIEEGLRNLRWVRVDPRGRIYLIHRDRLRVEAYTVDGSRLRTFTVKVKSGATYYPDESGEPKAPRKAEPETPRLKGGVVIPTPAAMRQTKPVPEDDPARQQGEKMVKGGVFNRMEVAGVTRDVALYQNRLYVLRSATLGSTSAKPAIDVFDTFGKWQEELVVEPHEDFTRLAIDEDGRIYLFTHSGSYALYQGDLGPESEPPAPERGASKAGAQQ